MLPLHADPQYTFRFTDDRVVPRFHLDGAPPGQPVAVFCIDPATGERLAQLAAAHVGDGGWVNLPSPIIVKAGEAFVAVVAPVVRPEAEADRDAVYRVNREAFGQDDEPRLVDQLRDGGYVRLSLVAEVAGRVVGHVLFSDMSILTDAGPVAALALAPVAVLPGFQNQGVGSALLRRGLDLCRERGHRIVIVLGHPHFYPRFGFRPDLAAKLDSPFPRDSFMALELEPGALAGVRGRVRYAPPFGLDA